MYSLNSAEIQEANSNAISRCAKVPPLRPDLEYIPIAAVVSNQRFGDKVNAFEPARDLNPSNFEGFKIRIM